MSSLCLFFSSHLFQVLWIFTMSMLLMGLIDRSPALIKNVLAFVVIVDTSIVSAKGFVDPLEPCVAANAAAAWTVSIHSPKQKQSKTKGGIESSQVFISISTTVILIR